MQCKLPASATLLVDVDAMCKLAHWGLLDVLSEVTGLSHTRCETLPSCRYRALRACEKPDGRLFRSPDAAMAVVKAVATFAEMPQPSADHLAVFQDVAGIDAGEVVLLARLMDDSDTFLLTGDKRALRSLAALSEEIRAPVSQRILSVECVVKCALERLGIEELRMRICPWKDVDKAIAIIMGSRCDLGEAAVREGLQSYLKELNELCTPPIVRRC